MVRPIARISLWGVLFCLLPLITAAQGYEISGESSLSGNVTLTIFDGDSSQHSHSTHIDRGLFLFSGSVSQPVLASLSHPSMHKPLYFYVENAEISIHLNASRPDASPIKGSRSNSEYRYLMERYRNSDDGNAFLRQYVRENATSIYAPFILYTQMQNIDEGALRQMIDQLSGNATHTYHYTLLRRWQRETPSVSEGSVMPNFAFANQRKEQVHFDDVRNPSGATLLIVGATWCDQCQNMVAYAERLVRDKHITLLYIRIDDSPAEWDAPFLKQLAIGHLPYIILVDGDGRVQARDVRQWELEDLVRRYE